MIRLIKMNIYRAVNSKSTWIIFAISMAFAIFAAYMEKTDLKAMKDSYAMIESEEVSMGITVNTPDIHEDGTLPYILEFICADIGSCILCIFITIFAAIFVNAEDSSGFVKNIAGQVKRKWMMYASKIVVIMIFTMLFMVSYAIAQGIGLYVFLEEPEFGTAMIGKAIKYALSEWLLYSAFASGIAMAATMLHSTPVSITWGLLSAMGVGMMMAGFVNNIIDSKNFNISEYFVTENIKRLVPDGTVPEYRNAIVLALAFFTIYNLIGSALVEKRDIKV